MALVCMSCGQRHAAHEPVWRCACGGLLDLDWSPTIDPDVVALRPWTMWRYREALPMTDDEAIVSLGEGCTPMVPMSLGHQQFLIKQDYLCPTGSYKDRGASVLISQAKALGIDHVVEDSSGNAGCAIAAYCAQAAIRCDIYVPASTSPDKLTQIEAYGATLRRVSGTREDTASAAWQAAQTAYYASHSWNPFFFQGTKTVAYEICEQMGWRAPDAVILPVGNGTLFLGAWIGFREMAAMRLIDHIPRLIGVQAASCAPLAHAWHKKQMHPAPVISGDTVAEGIAIAAPIRGQQILEAVVDTKGDLMSVSEEQTVAALHDLHQQGFYVEPTSATAWAAAGRLADSIPNNASVVLVLTGHGLKASTKIAHLGKKGH